MTQNHYIRPLNLNYHDFTQKKIQESKQQTPYKFRVKTTDTYMKKPKHYAKQIFHQVPSHFPPQIETHDNNCECCQSSQSCWEGFFRSCFPKTKQPQQKMQAEHEKTENSQAIASSQTKCKCSVLEPQLCGTCLSKLCTSCQQGLFLKFSMCQYCKNLLCLKCRDSVFCAPTQKLRNYPIRLKTRNNFHFSNCKCKQCESFTSKKQNQRGTIAEKQTLAVNPND